MKFRSKTGEVLRYRDIIPVLCKSGCDNCPIIADVLKHDNQSCQAWILNHPHKAARLMGYEVVEEMRDPQLNEGEMDKEMEKNHFSTIKEEANMDKLRICEVLGVEVDEVWHVTGNDNAIYRISGGVALEYAIPKCYEDGHGEWRQSDTVHLIDIINHPDRIIRKPRWTEQEVEDAKTIKRVFGRDGTIERHSKTMTVPYSTLTFDHLYISENLFPSLHPDESVTLDEIIGGKGDGA